MRIDSHQHFWEYEHEEYSWIGENMKVLQRDFLPHMLLHELAKRSFDGSIAVQARQTLNENDFLIDLALDNPDVVKGVVGWVDLCDPEVDRELEMYAQYEPFCGVRHLVQDEPDDDFMLRPDFQQGISKLGNYDLTYDLLTFPRHLTRAIRLVDRFPDQKFVLDHIGKPGIRENLMLPWKDQIRLLAQNPNVWCKLSGMVTEADWNFWSPEDFYPYLDVVLEAFGTERVMIGSDWPVCLLAGDYTSVIDIVSGYIRDLSGEDQRKIMGENCAAFYGIT